MRAWWKRNRIPTGAHDAAAEAEADAKRRLCEARRVLEAARQEAETQREIRRRNRFGPMITEALRGMK